MAPPVPLTVPMAMLPPLTVQLVQVLLTMANAPVGAAGVAQTPGVVVTLLVGLEILVSLLQLHRVSTVMAVVWLYTGSVVLQLPPLSVAYCRVEPAGQAEAGAAIRPPLSTQAAQVLWLLTTAGGAAAVKTGQQFCVVNCQGMIRVQPPLPSITFT